MSTAKGAMQIANHVRPPRRGGLFRRRSTAYAIKRRMHRISAGNHGCDWLREMEVERSTLMCSGKSVRTRYFQSARLAHLTEASADNDFTPTPRRKSSTPKAARQMIPSVMKRFLDRCCSVLNKSRSKRGRITMPSSCERTAQAAAAKHASRHINLPWRMLFKAERRQISMNRLHSA